MQLNSELISILINTVDIFFRALSFLIFVRILLTWVAPHSRGKIVYFIASATEPVLQIFRRLPLRLGMIDFSPIVALLTLDFIRQLLINVILGLVQ